MQKKLIALAVAGLVAAPAFAQSNVTIYGVVDAAIGFGSAGDNDFNGIVDGVLSGNRVGFRGSEDLGGGLKAVFQLEQGFDIGNGYSSAGGADSASRSFNRQSYVGLQGSFGTVSLGRQYAPGYNYVANYDAFAGATISPQSVLSSKAGMTITPNSPARWDNSVNYAGSFGPVSAQAIYAFKGVEAGTSVTDDDAFGIGVGYKAGGLNVGAVYHNVGYAAKDQKEFMVGAAYNFGFLTLAGSWQNVSDLGGIKDNDADLYQIGVVVPVSSNGNVHVAFGTVDPDADKTGADSWTLAYTHALSKRTTAYAGYNMTSNDNRANKYGLVPSPKEQYGEDSSLFAVGVRHTF